MDVVSISIFSLALTFGRYAREPATLVCITKSGGLIVKMMRRGQDLEGKDLTQGPPEEQGK